MLITFVAIGATHALYLTILVLIKRNKGGPDYILATYLGTLFITFAITYFAVEWDVPDLMAFQLNISLLLAPLFFIYISSLTKPQKPPLSTLALHLLPYVLTWIYWGGLFLSSTESELNTLFLESDDSQLPLLFILALLLEALAIPVYVCWSLWILRTHKRTISDAYSYTEGIDLKWAYALAVCTGALWVSIVVIEAIQGTLTWVTDDHTMQTGYAFAAFFVYYLGYFGLKQGHITSLGHSGKPVQAALEEPAEIEPPAKYQKSGLKKEVAKAYAEALVDYVETEKPYLQSRLSIQDIARAINIPQNHLSQIINEHLGQTFYDFVNQYRVEEFKRRIAHPQYKNYTLISIALDCGFNSKSSFNRIFKKLEGLTPSAYVKATD